MEVVPGRFTRALYQNKLAEAATEDPKGIFGQGKRPWEVKPHADKFVVTRKYRHYDSNASDPMEDLWIAKTAQKQSLSQSKLNPFPESKVQRPVYHGTAVDFKRPSLSTSTQGIIWFTSDLQSIEDGDAGAQGRGFVKKWWVDLKNPAGWDEYDKLGLYELKRAGYDGAILPKGNGLVDGFVFSPSQVRNA